METAFYLYTIVVMLACVASGSVSLSAYFVSRRRSFLYAALMLLFYFLDLALIFQYEYLGQNVEYSITQFYTIDHPQLKMLLALGTLEPMWLILCDFVNEKRRALGLFSLHHRLLRSGRCRLTTLGRAPRKAYREQTGERHPAHVLQFHCHHHSLEGSCYANHTSK